MTDTDFHTRRTQLANAFAAAGAELLEYMRAPGTLAAIPNTSPEQYVVAGDLTAIQALLPNRRERRGQRPTDVLYFGPEAGQPRRWTILITEGGKGVVADYGYSFPDAKPEFERVDVVEVSGIANKAAEEGELLREVHQFLGDMHAMPVEWTIEQSQVLCAKVSAAIAADRAARPSTSIESLKRFDFEVEDGQKYNIGNPDGKWVKFFDVEALLSGGRAARAGASEDERDAARYRWLRGSATDIGNVIDKEFAPGKWEYRAGEELDAAIDKAMGVRPAAPSAPVGAVPEGWKLVPIEPTQAMLDEITLLKEFTPAAMRARYAAMLAAAPAISHSGEGEKGGAA